MKQTTKVLLSAVLTIALCVSVISGATFALFTDTAETNIAVNAGKVNVTATLGNLKTYSMGDPTTTNLTFANGGTAGFTDDAHTSIKLDKITPGDKVTFDVTVTNNSNVDIQYRLTWAVEGDLLGVNGLQAKVGTADLVNGTSAWTEWKATDTTKTQTLNVSIELPVEAGNNYQEKEATISFKVEAVQANGTDLYGKTLVNTVDELDEALKADDDNIIALTETLEIKENTTLDLNGKTVEGDLVVTSGTLTVSDGTLANTDSAVSAIQMNGGEVVLNDVEIQSARHGVRVESGKLTINGGTYKAAVGNGKGTYHAINVGENNAACEVIINGGTFIGPKGTSADSGAAVNVQAGSKVTINGGNFSGGLTKTLSGATTDLTVNGGTFDQDPSAYVDTTKYAVTNANGVYSVAMKSETVTDLFANVPDGGTVNLTAGTYTIPSAVAGKEITIEGVGDDTVIDFTKVNTTTGSSITFKNLKIQGKNENVMNGFGIQGTTGHIAYEDCTFDGAVTNEYYGTVSYKNCTFTGTGYITTYAVKSATFENCVFDKADSRAVLVYSHGDNPCKVTLTDCTFKAAAKATTWAGDWTAAVEVDTTNIPTAGTSVSITNCTYDDMYSNIVRDKSATGKANAVITVDGKTIAGTYQALQNALNAGKTEIAIVGNITLTGGLSASNVTFVGLGENAGIDFNGHNIGGSNSITYKNLHLSTISLPQLPENGERYGWYGGIDYNGHSVSNYEGCTIEGVFTTYSDTVNVTGCTFNPYIQDGEEFYHIFVYGSNQVKVTGSTFNYADRAIKIYNEGGVKNVEFNISDSKFIATEDATVNKSLINVDATYMTSVKVNIDNITIDDELTGVVVCNENSKVTVTQK